MPSSRVLLRLWQHRDEVQPAATAASLFQVACTAIADFHRARQKGPQPLADDFDEPPRDGDGPRELAACLLPLLVGLPAADRALLERVDLRGETQAALAGELGLSLSGVKSRVQRARSRLRLALTDCCRLELDRTGLPTDDYERRRTCDCDCRQ